jgi:hypothetical protein
MSRLTARGTENNDPEGNLFKTTMIGGKASSAINYSPRLFKQLPFFSKVQMAGSCAELTSAQAGK